MSAMEIPMPHSSDRSIDLDELLSMAAEPAWPEHSHVLVRAVERPGGQPLFILPKPITVTGRSPGELLRIEVAAAVSMGDAAKILREIARCFTETDRFMWNPKVVDTTLPIPGSKKRKKRK
jgi:hypothetical protein